MLEYLTGILKPINKQLVTLDVGVAAFQLNVPDSNNFPEQPTTSIYTYLHWNQESGPQLFGFNTMVDREVFLLVISCSGIGPKIGLAILAQLGAASFMRALVEHNEQILATVPGIGLKKAEQIIVQLKHKAAKLIENNQDIMSENNINWHELSQALESLNYSKLEINYALNQIRTTTTDHRPSFDQLLRRALGYLTKQQ